MPPHYRDKYQYLPGPTRPNARGGCEHVFQPLEQAVADYVCQYLEVRP